VPERRDRLSRLPRRARPPPSRVHPGRHRYLARRRAPIRPGYRRLHRLGRRPQAPHRLRRHQSSTTRRPHPRRRHPLEDRPPPPPDDELELGDRVAGCLVLLYGQQLSRVVTITFDQISEHDGVIRLHLGATHIDIPAPPQQPAHRAGRRPPPQDRRHLTTQPTLAVPRPRPRPAAQRLPPRPAPAPHRHPHHARQA